MAASIRFCTISEIQPDKGMVKGTFEDLNISSAELHVFMGRTNKTKDYSFPKIGERGLALLVENGQSGIYLGGHYDESNSIPDGSGEGKTVTLFADGSTVIFDENSSKMTINILSNIDITCPSITIKGNIDIKGNVTVSEDVVASGISLVTHKHTGIVVGGGTTGGPV